MDTRMRSRIPVMEQILAATGQPGVSVGVMHGGKVVLNHSIGYRDVDKKLKADGDTLYCIGSLSKAFVTACLAILVKETNVKWEDRATDLVPTLRMFTDHGLADRLTLTDLVSHRSGIISLDQLVQGLDGKILVPKSDAVNLMNELPSRSDIRSEFGYTNVPFSVAGQILEDHGGAGSWDAFLAEKLLRPLKMSRTTADWEAITSDSNLAQPYTTLPGGRLAPLEQPEVSASTLHGCAGGIRSTVNDMLKWSKAMLSVVRSTDGANILGLGSSDMSPVFERKTIIDPRLTTSGEYCMGWVRQQTPATLGMISPNRRFCSPVMGKTSPSQVVYSHDGNVKGYMASICLFPEEDSAIVALTNGTGMGDCADWIAQDLAQEMFGFQPAIDWVAVAEEAARTCEAWYQSQFVEPLREHQLLGTVEPPVSDFLGEYARSKKGNTAIRLEVVAHCTRCMNMVINGRVDQAYHLQHYHYDTWCLLPSSQDDAIKRGYLGIFGGWEECLVSFERQANGKVGRISWKLNGVVVRFERLGSA